MNTPKERPIIFSAPMVRAILEGRKTQTRRKIKTHGREWFMDENDTGVPWPYFQPYVYAEPEPIPVTCPYGQPKDRLWVRETFQPIFADGFEWGDVDWSTGHGYAISYPATDGIQEFQDIDCDLTDRCRPSIHMPRWASRITLEITGVRVERLQGISPADCMAEGVIFEQHGEGLGDPCDEIRAMHAYQDLWESISGAGSWDANPWVWVVEFQQT